MREPREAGPGREAAAWAGRAEQLAAWAWRFVNRRDVWGGYYRAADGAGNWATCQTTRPAKAERGRRLLGPPDLARHFRATATRDVIGLHTTSPENLSHWGAVDVDCHGPGGNDPRANLAAALAWFAELVRLGFRPLLTDSNGKGGYHLRFLLSGPAPTPDVYALLKRLTADYARHGLTAGPEVFPKQPRIEAGKYGNWLRLPGRHHTREQWSNVWDGRRWLAGAEAVDLLLTFAGDRPGLVPSRPAEAPRRPAGPPAIAGEVRQLAPRIAAYMKRLPNLGEGQGRDDVAYSFACWLVRDLALSDAVALEWLDAWDRGNTPPKGRERLREIITGSRKYGKKAVGCGLGGRRLVAEL
jgi:hypothetical protein